jgi:hypothetical protein
MQIHSNVVNAVIISCAEYVQVCVHVNEEQKEAYLCNRVEADEE